MADLLGVSLEAGVVRAALRSNGRPEVMDVPWDSARPELGVDALRAKFGKVSGIALSIGLAFLEIAQPELPPLQPDDLRRVLLRDSDRYFPTESSVAITVPGPSGIAYATLSERLHQWVAAFSQWAPVTSVMAAPIAIAAGVSAVHRAAPDSKRILSVDAAQDEIGLIRLADGAVVEVRRIPVALAKDIPAGTELLNDIFLPGTTGAYAAALGAIALAAAPLDMMLLDHSLEAALKGRRSRRRWGTYVLLAAAALVFSAALDARRAEVLARTSHARDSLAALAGPARISRARLEQLEREAQILAARQVAHDPLHVVAALGDLLPTDVFIERVSWDGVEWRVDGSADRAASIVPSLDSSASFANVRVLAASTRFRDGNRMRESFAVAFRAKGDSVAKR